jgi:hypothetical protein
MLTVACMAARVTTTAVARVGLSYRQSSAKNEAAPGSDDMTAATPEQPQIVVREDHTSDEVLMQNFCDGDAQAFSVLFDRYSVPLRRMLHRMTGNLAMAHDLTQTAFVSVVRARDRYRPGSRFKPWLMSSQ